MALARRPGCAPSRTSLRPFRKLANAGCDPDHFRNFEVSGKVDETIGRGAMGDAPKLLELDKEDVKAVRSFLPGKVLGRTAALLALVVLVLGFAGSLDVAVEKFLGFPLKPPWLKYTVLIGLPILIVGTQILAEWAADRKRKQAQALAVKVDAVPEGYFRIGPYLDTAEDRAKFDRADGIHKKVLD
jgi:hypothetical protein